MSSAIANALSGLEANSTAINVVSGNLANLNTTGYKDVQVSFEDLVNQSLSGFTNSAAVSGATVAQATQNFSQGTLETTGGPYDAAIQGGGFFVVQQPSGATEYTRQGNFQVAASGDLMTSTGQYVQGWNQSGGVLSTNGPTGNITLPNSLTEAPVATSTFSLDVNLAGNAAGNATFSSPIQIFDAQGNAHTLTVTYTETAANTWGYAVTLPAGDLSSASTNPLASGTMTFDGSGNLLTPANAAGAGSIAIPVTLANGASLTGLTWNLYDASGNATISQSAQTSSNISTTQGGSAASQLSSMSIGAGGTIVATFSNGSTENVAQIALASVLNPSSMVQVDGNSFAATGNTAAPVIGMPSSGARGSITGGALETSTVDIATELTNLLTYERGYEANSKVITTEDNIVQDVLTLIPTQ